MSVPLALRVRRTRGTETPLPAYQTEGAAGMDLCAEIEGEVVIAPGDRALVPTGLAVALPPGHEGQVRPRSGLALKHGVTVLNAPGTIDEDYRGEVGVVLINHGREPFRVSRHMRIAQLVVAPVTRVAIAVSDDLDATARAGGGYGSTGV